MNNHTKSINCPHSAHCFKDLENAQLESRLQAQVRRITTLIANHQEAVLLENEHGVIEQINERFCDLFGLETKASELIGSPAHELMNFGTKIFIDPESFKSSTIELSKNRVYVTRQNLVTKSGKFYQRDFYPIWDDVIYLGQLWIYRDVAETFQNKLQLQKLQDFYEHILNSLPAEINVLNARGEHLFINPASLGDEASRDWIIGRSEMDYRISRNLPTRPAIERQQRFEQAIETRSEQLTVEVVEDKNQIKYKLHKYFPILSMTNEVDMVIGFAIDITDRIKAEKALELSKQKMDEVTKMKTQFLTDMSHGLRTPLNGVLGVLQLLKRSHLSSGQREQLNMMEESAGNLRTLITNCLDKEHFTASGNSMLAPIKGAGAATSDNHSTTEKSLQGKRILVAEDVLLNQYIVKTFLEDFGCIVEVADNGKIAVEKASCQQYDLILMDMQMPEMNGIDATALIRSDKRTTYSSVPIVALTANALKGVREQCLDAGMNDYVSKPFTKLQLRSTIQSLIA